MSTTPNYRQSTSEENGLSLITTDDEVILSIGISTGLAAEIQMLGGDDKKQITATTLDPKGVEFAQKIIEENKLSDNLSAMLEDVSLPMPYSDQSFDYIYARLVLHYLDAKQLDNALAELRRVLKVNKKIFIVVRSNKCPDALRDNAKYDSTSRLTTCTVVDDKTGKERTYTRYFHTMESIRDHVVNAGFRIIKTDQYDEQLYVDFERIVPSAEKDNVIEIVAVNDGR
jgi:SAM-dependent methyltransferase